MPLPAIPDHELLRCIGRGAYGAVWLARNVMGTLRAVKVLHREDFARDRPFTREYEGLLKYEPVSRSHPNLMQILQVGRRDEYFYYVTELADDAGERKNAECRMRNEPRLSPSEPPSPFSLLASSLASYVPRTLQEDLERRGRLPVRECVSLATALASALKYLHDHALIHRDVKPSNVIFVHGVPKLADIGLVATVGDSRSIVGTEGYLPPEGPGKPQADLYALGKLLYEVSTGMNRADYPRLPQDLRERADATELLELNEVLLRACAKDTDRRYHRADDLLADLALLERGASVKRLRRLEGHYTVIKRVGIGALAVGLVIFAARWQSWGAHRIARRPLAQSHLNEATQRMVQGDYAAALPQLVGALDLDAGDLVREAAHRVRIASVLERCPRPVAHFAVLESEALQADLSPDATVLATAHEDGGVRLWNIRSGKCIQRLPHDFPAVLCEFLPPGDRLLTGSLGQRAYLWDLASSSRDPLILTQAFGFGSAGYSLGFNEALGPSGRVYLAKGANRFAKSTPFTGPFESLTLALWLTGGTDTLVTHYEVRRTAPGREVLWSGEFRDSPEFERLDSRPDEPSLRPWGPVFVLLENPSFGTNSGQSGESVWDNLKVRRYRSGEAPTPWRVVDDFSNGALSNWALLAPPGSTTTCRVVNGQLRLLCENLPTEERSSPMVGWLELFGVSRGHTLEVEVDLIGVRAPDRCRRVALSLYHPTPAAFAARAEECMVLGRWLVLTWWGGTVRIWDLEKERFVTVEDDGRAVPLEVHLPGGLFNFDVSPDAKYLAHVVPHLGSSSRCAVWDLRTGREIATGNLAQWRATGVRFSRDSRLLALTHREGLELIRTRDWQSEHRLGTGWSLGKLCFSPRGSRLAAVRDGRDAAVWDLGDLAEPPAVFARALDIQRLVFSPDGRHLAASYADGIVHVWDVIRQASFGPPLPGLLGRFSPDGTQLLLSGAEGGVCLWDLSQVADDVLTVPPHRAEQTFARSTDGAMTAEIEGPGIVLTTKTGRFSLATPVQAALSRVAFCPAGRYLIAESPDLRVWVWDLRTRTLTGPPWLARYDAALTNHCLPELTAESRDLRTLSDVAALLAGERPDGTGHMIPVAEAERVRLLRELQGTAPAEFRADDANHGRWHRKQASAAEQAMDWEAAVFHWEQALRMKSEVQSPQSEAGDAESAIPAESRLAYARQAAEVVRQKMLKGDSRWSVILPRPPWATSEMLDLRRFYTRPLGEPPVTSQPGASFRELSSGVHHLGGTGFEVRGIIELSGTNAVTIPVGRACKRVHFLHAANRPAVGVRETSGRYQVTYVDGEKVSVQVWNPEDVPSYAPGYFWAVSEPEWAGTLPELHCALVWSGCTPNRAGHPALLFLTRMTWELPELHQGEVIESLELQAGPAESAPLVFAITVESAP